MNRTQTMSQVNAEVEQIRADIAAQQDEATKKVQELLQSLEESRKSAKEEAEKEIGQAKQAREEADAYAAEKRESADTEAREIVRKAGEEASKQIEDRRKAAQSELDGLRKRIGELQTREADITQRVSELRSMFANAFAGFGFGIDKHSTDTMSVVNTVAGDNDSSDTPQSPADNGSVRSDLANTMLINPSDSAQHEASHPMSHVTVPVAPALHDHAAQANAADDDNAGTNDEAQVPAVDIPADPNTPSPEAPEAPAASAAEVMEAIDGDEPISDDTHVTGDADSLFDSSDNMPVAPNNEQ